MLATFLLAGAVKGVVGLGLPTVSLAILVLVVDLPSAMALLIAPSFVTNVWQAVAGHGSAAVLRRIWPFLLTAGATVWVGALALTRVDTGLLAALLGLVLASYALSGLVGLRVCVPPRHENWVGPLVGTANGVLAGMTGAFAVPGVMFLQGIGLSREALIQAMGMLFTVSTVALGLALRQNDLFSAAQGVMSAAAVVPALAGMALGQRLGRRLSEALFRRAFFAALLVMGGYIAVRALA